MFDFQSQTAEFRAQLSQEALVKLFDYWVSHSVDGRLPARSQIDPLDVPDLLSGIFLIDVDYQNGEPRFRFRLIGSRIATVVESDPTGMWFEDFYDKNNIGYMQKLYRSVALTGEPFTNHSHAPFSDKDFVKLDRLLLPLSSDGSQVDMILGYLSFENA